MSILHLSPEEFEEKVRGSERPVLVDFWADWCGPCRMMAPVIEEIADGRDDIVVAKFNVDDDTDMALSYGVSSIPAFMLFEGGAVTKQAVGYMTKDELLAQLGLTE